MRRLLDVKWKWVVLQRTPVDLEEKRVRLVGTLVVPDLVNAEGVAPVWPSD